MASNFRLLRASGGFENGDLLTYSSSRPPARLDVEFAERPSNLASVPWVSVVIGKNGVGKSRLLAGIADIFDTIFRDRGRRRSDGHSVSYISYSYDGRVCEIRNDETNRLSATIDGNRCDLADLPLPTKVIALTTTPFDKFRVSRSLMRMPEMDDADTTERYAYLGLRDRSGRASPTAAIFRALEGLFEASRSEMDRRLRISEIFGFLGYKPNIEVRYEFASSNFLRLKSIVDGDTLETIIGRDGILRRPLGRMLERDQDLLFEMREIAREVLIRSRGGRAFSLRADFEGLTEDDQFFQRVQLLRRADLLRMSSVFVQRASDGTVLDLRLASSGELGIVTGFLGLASVIEDGSLIFIDEPEISLHPEWQTQYIELLLKTFGKMRGCHFVLATHSPLVLSDISPENANVVSLDVDRRAAEGPDDFAGQSSDSLLVTAFQVPGKNNLYLKQQVIKALRLAADGKAGTADYLEVVSPLVELLPQMSEGSPVAELIRELDNASKATIVQ